MVRPLFPPLLPPFLFEISSPPRPPPSPPFSFLTSAFRVSSPDLFRRPPSAPDLSIAHASAYPLTRSLARPVFISSSAPASLVSLSPSLGVCVCVCEWGSQVESVTSAFPAVPPEAIVYDLLRTRSAQATVERLLTTGGTLPAVSPPSFPPCPLPRLPTSGRT